MVPFALLSLLLHFTPATSSENALSLPDSTIFKALNFYETDVKRTKRQCGAGGCGGGGCRGNGCGGYNGGGCRGNGCGGGGGCRGGNCGGGCRGGNCGNSCANPCGAGGRMCCDNPAPRPCLNCGLHRGVFPLEPVPIPVAAATCCACCMPVCAPRCISIGCGACGGFGGGYGGGYDYFDYFG